MSTEASVLYTDNGDGSADFTVSIDEENHKFSASGEDGDAVVEYEETLSWRAQIRTSEPSEEVFKAVMVSDEMTQFLEDNDLSHVRRSGR